MKNSILSRTGALVAAFVMALLAPIAGIAQDTKDLNVDVDINKGGDAGSFMSQPWVWIVGGAVFILLLVALLRGRGGRGDA